MEIEIQTPRLRLRRYRLDDIDAVLEMFSDKYARRLFPDMQNRSSALAWIETAIRHYDKYGYGLWVQELKNGPPGLVGDCGLTWQEVQGHMELEFGTHLVARLRGNGLSEEAGFACLDWGFRNLPCKRIVSIVRIRNIAAAALATKLHARRSVEVFDGPLGPHRIFSTERTDWEQR